MARALLLTEAQERPPRRHESKPTQNSADMKTNRNKKKGRTGVRPFLIRAVEIRNQAGNVKT